MLQRYFLKPYRFVPPYRGKFWCRLAEHVMPNHLRRKMGVPQWHFQGLEHLRDSLARGAGILLAVNHCRWADPLVLGAMSIELKQYLYYVVSYHLFKQNPLLGWWINRIGGYSILREGSDREAIRATSQLIAEGERPVVMFPEGTWFRQNDRIGPLQEGLTLIVRQAAKQTERPILVHPVSIKYWLLEDPRAELERRLERIERNLGWRPQAALDLPARIVKLGQALLAVKEVEEFDRVQAGSLDERIQRLAAAKVADLEKVYLGKEYDGWTLERIRRLRQLLVRKLLEVKKDRQARRVVREALDELLFCENLAAQSHEYLMERPSLERITETVQRIEETLTDEFEKSVAPHGATLAMGPALDVRSFAAVRGAARGGDPLLQRLSADMQGLLTRMLDQGPPREWNCPPAVERPAPAAAAAAPAPAGVP